MPVLFDVRKDAMYVARYGKPHEDGRFSFDVYLQSECGAFIGSAALMYQGNDTYSVDGIVARPRFGYVVHQALLSFVTQKGGFLTITPDGDARGGALDVWGMLYKNKNIISKSLENDIDWTNSEDNPELFSAYQFIDVPSIVSPRIFEMDMSEFKRKGFDDGATIFHEAYTKDSNKWIEDEYPMHYRPEINEVEMMSSLTSSSTKIKDLSGGFLLRDADAPAQECSLRR